MRRPRHRYAFAVLPLALAGRLGAATVSDWGRGFAKPAIAGQGADAAGKTLAFGHLELKLGQGRLFPVVVLDRVVGAFFTGQGSIRYVSVDQAEAATYRHNVKEVSDYEIDAAGAIGDSLDAALIVAPAVAEGLGGDPAWSKGEVPAAAAERFATHVREWAKDQGWRIDAALPQVMIEAPQGFSIVEIDGAKHDLIHVHDTLRHSDEDLMVLKESESDHPFFRDHRYQLLLSEQPIGRARLDPRPTRFRLVDVDGTLVNPAGIQAEVTVRETVVAAAPARTLDFNLPTVWRGTVGVTAKLAENPYRLTAVTDGTGAPLPFWHAHDGLTVELGKPLAAGEEVELRFAMAGEILFHPNNDSYWSLGGNWFPSPPRRDQEAYTYHVVVKVAKPFTAFSSGATVRRWDEGPLACAEFRETKPLQGAVLLAGKYTTYVEERKGMTVRVSAYAIDKPDAMKKIASLAFSFIDFYVPLLGEYPWPELNILEINSYGFGVAPPGVIYITKEAFVPATLDPIANLVIRGINHRLAHEVAHSWWGNVTLLGSAEENWMWEATADYYAAFAMGSLKGKGEFEEALRRWRHGTKESSDKGSVLLANQLAGDEAWQDRVRLLYQKGPLVLHALRQEVGDDTFFTILKSFQRSFKGKPAYTRDLIGISSFITKKDMAPFFERYVLGTEIPEIRK